MIDEPITEEERREQLERKAELKNARIAAAQIRKENNARENAKEVYTTIWAQFSEDRKKGRAFAYAKLIEGLNKHCSDLVPTYMTDRDRFGIIKEAESFIGENEQSQHESIPEMVGKWLSGEIELSRIPLEKKAE